jgi:hypothetical protein
MPSSPTASADLDLLVQLLAVLEDRSVTQAARVTELIAPLRRALRQTARVVDFPAFDPAVDGRVVASPSGWWPGRTVPESLFVDEGVDVLFLSFASRYPRERLYDDRWSSSPAPARPRTRALSTC